MPQDIVIPEKKGESTATYWSGVATNVSSVALGHLHVDITIINNTTDWSKFEAGSDTPALLVTQDEKSTDFGVVDVSISGHSGSAGDS